MSDEIGLDEMLPFEMAHPHPSLRDTFTCLGEGLGLTVAFFYLGVRRQLMDIKIYLPTLCVSPPQGRGGGTALRWVRMPPF